MYATHHSNKIHIICMHTSIILGHHTTRLSKIKVSALTTMAFATPYMKLITKSTNTSYDNVINA